MAAPVVVPPAVAAVFVALLQGLGMVTQADLAAAVAPLATQAQVAAQIAALPTRAQFQALQAQVAALPTLAQFQALLAQLGAPAIAAAAAATAQTIAAARAQNAHDSSAVPYAVVPRADGTPPPAWPAAFDRNSLRSGPIAAVNALLHGYGVAVPPGAAALARRNALALHIGTMRL